MTERLRVAVLGSTGSIGRQALDVAARIPSASRSWRWPRTRSAELLAEQARRVRRRARRACRRGRGRTCVRGRCGRTTVRSVGAGADAVVAAAPSSGRRRRAQRARRRRRAARLGRHARGGQARSRSPTRSRSSSAASSSCRAGASRTARSRSTPSTRPSSSASSARTPRDVARIWLTASGGPFRGRTPRRARDGHRRAGARAPHAGRWGRRSPIDSATLMNKGLEVIEAHHLFGVGYDHIRVVVHPQCCIHSMVEFADGSGEGAPRRHRHARPDPVRASATRAAGTRPLPPVDFARSGARLRGAGPRDVPLPALCALEAGRAGGTMPAVMNAANEVAVAAFLAGAMRLPRHRARRRSA